MFKYGLKSGDKGVMFIINEFQFDFKCIKYMSL